MITKRECIGLTTRNDCILLDEESVREISADQFKLKCTMFTYGRVKGECDKIIAIQQISHEITRYIEISDGAALWIVLADSHPFPATRIARYKKLWMRYTKIGNLVHEGSKKEWNIEDNQSETIRYFGYAKINKEFVFDAICLSIDETCIFFAIGDESNFPPTAHISKYCFSSSRKTRLWMHGKHFNPSSAFTLFAKYDLKTLKIYGDIDSPYEALIFERV